MGWSIRCRRCGKWIHRTHWTWNGWKHVNFGLGEWTPEDRDHDASPE